MNIVIAHNYYQQPGGEDQVFVAETELLRRHGHDIHTFVLDNDAIETMGRVRTLAATFWNRETHRSLRQLVRDTRADVVHFHNTFPLISPSAYAAAREAGAAVVQTLHNFRVICPSAVLLRDGKPCEACVGRTFALPGVMHACYRGSRMASATVAAMTAAHRLLGTWDSAVDAYIAPTRFAREKLIEGGLPAEKICIKPNFVDPDPGLGAGSGGYALFVGRLSEEKGVHTLLESWTQAHDLMPLMIIGDGPLSKPVMEAAATPSNIRWLGRRALDEVYDWIGNAACLVSPSQCYETFGRVIIEAFAKGTPVIAAGHGAATDLVRHGQTGLHFEPGSPAALASAVHDLARSPERRDQMRTAARYEYEQHYTGEHNYEQLVAIYNGLLAGRAVQANAGAMQAPRPMAEVGA